MKLKLLIINGPNLHNIGIREPNYYGNVGFIKYLDELKKEFTNLDLEYFQTHSESDIVKKIHDSSQYVNGIILNAGAYSHTSVSIRDAVASINKPVVLVHITNIYSREPFRQNNVIAPVCDGIITGFGLKSYKLAIKNFI